MALAGAAWLPAVAQAQSIWGGAGSATTTSDYNLGTNWSTNPTAPTAAGSSAQFTSSGLASVTVTAGPITPDSWTFLANSQNYTITGAAVNFANAATLTDNASAGQSISIANNMTGVNLSQAAASTLTISGTNSFTNTNISAGTLVNNGSLTSTVGNSGTFTNNLTVTGAVNNAGTFNNNAAGTVSGLLTSNGGVTNNAGQLNGGVNVVGGAVSNSNTVAGGVTVNGGTYTQTAGTTSGGLTNNSGGIVNANGGAIIGAIANNAGGTFNVGGTVSSNSTFTNSTATSRLLVNTGNYTVTGLITNSGTNAAGGILVANGATLAGISGLANNAAATIINNGITNKVLNSNGGTVTNAATGVWSGNVVSNTSSATGITNSGVWNGNVLANTGTIVNNLTWNGTVTNTFIFTNNASGTVSGLVTNNGGGSLTTSGTLSNGLTNSGIVFAQGTINGAIANNAGGINVVGALVGNSTFNNAAAATINVNNQSFTGITTYTNAGTTNLGGGGAGTIGATSLVNTASGTINSSGTTGTITTTSITNSGTFLNNGTTTGTFTMAAGNLSGIGNTQSLTVNGGTFAPGNGTAGTSMTVTGSLVLQAAATYLVQVNPATASFANVTGTAALGGATVSANFAAGSYVSKQYTIVQATGTVTGTFNPTVVNTNLPSNFHTTLSYDAHDAYLNLALNFAPPPGRGLNVNQQNVGNAIIGFFNRTGGIPLVFGALTPAGLTQISGETATGTQQTTFDAMTQFMGVMTDPFTGSRVDGAPSGSNATPFAEEIHAANADAARNPARSQSERDAYAAIYRKAPVMAVPFVPSWSVWAAGFGGSQTTDGNTTLGSNTATSRLGAVAVGADYRFSPNTIAGFALAGGGTSFSVANGGTGRSDLFQAGAFVRHTVGPAYFSAALAYGWQDITTDRTVTIAGIDQLRAKFNANAFSGRVEDGYRFVTPWMGITPYAAGQFTTFDLPAYAESVVSGANNFALAFGAKSVTATRSEVGLRTDKSWAMPDSIFTLRGRFGWAHDYNVDRSIGATFQTLPGASFVVNGATQSPDKALTTGSAEVKWRSGFSLAATFEGEFSGNSSSYAGKGVARYQW